MSEKLNIFGKFLKGMRGITSSAYDQYELATSGKVTPTTYTTAPSDEPTPIDVDAVQSPIEEEIVNGLIKATCDCTIKTGKKLPIEAKIQGKVKNLVVELRSSFIQFIVEREYKELTNMNFIFTNIVQDDNEVKAYYNAIQEYSLSKGYDVDFIK